MSHKLLLTGGHILSMDPDIGQLPDGDVLIDDGKIVMISPGINHVDAEVLDVTGNIVMPGFVDSHRHVWQGALRGISADDSLGSYFGTILGTIAPNYSPDDLALGTLIGAVEALDAGVTTVFDWCNATNTPDHAEAAIDALQAAGIRAVFGHGNAGDADHVRALRAGVLSADNGLVTLGLAIAGPEYASLEATTGDIALARELGVVASMHVGGGTAGPKSQAVRRMASAGLLSADLNFVHCNTISDEEVAMLIDAGSGISVTPVIECLMGHGSPAYSRFLDAGGDPSLGTDVVVAASGDAFAQMRCALTVARMASNKRLLDAGSDPQSVSPAAADMLRATTLAGAKAIGLDDRIGSLAVGKRADIVVLRGAGLPRDERLAGAIATVVGPGDVEAVLVEGRLVKRNGRLVDQDLEALRAKATSSAHTPNRLPAPYET